MIGYLLNGTLCDEMCLFCVQSERGGKPKVESLGRHIALVLCQ